MNLMDFINMNRLWLFKIAVARPAQTEWNKQISTRHRSPSNLSHRCWHNHENTCMVMPLPRCLSANSSVGRSIAEPTTAATGSSQSPTHVTHEPDETPHDVRATRDHTRGHTRSRVMTEPAKPSPSSVNQCTSTTKECTFHSFVIFFLF